MMCTWDRRLLTLSPPSPPPQIAACEDPNVIEIFDCLKYLKLPADIEVGSGGIMAAVGDQIFGVGFVHDSNTPLTPPCPFLPPKTPQDKQYPRDWWMSRGRLRVELFNQDGTPTNPEIPTREWRL